MTAPARPTPEQAAYLSGARVGRLSTVDAEGQPYLVPFCFAYVGGCVYSPLDEKPKSVEPTELKRVRNILENPRVALVVDSYSEDWGRLAYLSVRGVAGLVRPGEGGHAEAVGALREKYPRYKEMAIHERPLIRIEPRKFTSWGALSGQGRPGLDLMGLLRGRRSVRWYTPEPVAPEVARLILEAGRWAPSPHGRQPWRFAVLTRPEPKERLAGEMAALWREQLALDGQPPEVVETRLRKARERLVGAPLVVVLCLYLGDLDAYPDEERQGAETLMAVQSLGAAAQNMLLAAYGLGLDGGWMCAPLFSPDAVRDALHLPAALIPHAMLTFGHAARDPVRRERRPLDELIELYE